MNNRYLYQSLIPCIPVYLVGLMQWKPEDRNIALEKHNHDFLLKL